MGPQPIGQNAQVQRLTTALTNICRDYPAGGTVLRELLQNADDAGATEVVRTPLRGFEAILVADGQSLKYNEDNCTIEDLQCPKIVDTFCCGILYSLPCRDW
jgi:hypothetical protein